MVVNPLPTAVSEHDEKPLSYEGGWDLLWSLEGSMEGWLPEEGGPSGILAKERELWDE